METRETLENRLYGGETEDFKREIDSKVREGFNLYSRIKLAWMWLFNPEKVLVVIAKHTMVDGYHLGLKDAAEIIEKRKEQAQ